MKNKLITLCLSISGITAFAQDTLKVSDVILSFDTTDIFYYHDTLTLTYLTEYIGEDSNPEFVQKANVINGSGTYLEVEDSVLTTPEITPITLGSEYEMKASVRLTRTYFKDGNNTVVIWPEKTDGPFIVKDPTEFEVFIGGSENTFILPSTENTFKVVNNQLILSNESSQNQTIQIYNLNGQIFSQLILTSKNNASVNLPSGIFIVAILSGKEKKALKILVE